MPEYQDFRATFDTIMWILGMLAAVGGAAAIVIKACSPFKKLRADVNRHAELLAKDKARIDAQEDAQRLQLKAMVSLVDHELTGNSVDKLKKIKEEINEFLINK